VGGDYPQQALTRVSAQRNLPGGEAVAVNARQDVAGVDDEKVCQQIAPVEHRMKMRQWNRSGVPKMVHYDQRSHDEPECVQPAAAGDAWWRRIDRLFVGAGHAED
jgi:hypothetical protein